MAFPTYTTGTVSIGAGATSADGTSTVWSGINARAGDLLLVGGFLTVVKDVTDATHLVIPAWTNAAQTAVSYTLFQSSPFRFVGGQAMADVSTLIAALDKEGFYWFVGPTETAPDNSIGNDGQYARKPDTEQEWSKVGGVWVPRTGLINFTTPQGRLTLTSGVAVMTSSVASSTSLYYTPCAGNRIPLFNGTDLVMRPFTELLATTTNTTKNPAAIGASAINDWFVWDDAGVIRLSHGPSWTNTTTRSAGTALTYVNGIALNSVAITNGPAVQRGTYVGTTWSNAGSTIDWILGGSASGGVAAVLGVWNAFNRCDALAHVFDIGASYTYTGAVRQQRASTAMQVSFVVGLSGDLLVASNQEFLLNAAVAASFCGICIGYDDLSNFVADAVNFGNGAASMPFASFQTVPMIGYHVVYAMERGDGSNANSFNLSASFNKAGLNVRLPM